MDSDFSSMVILLVITYLVCLLFVFLAMKRRLIILPRMVTSKVFSPFFDSFMNGRIRNLKDVEDFILSFRPIYLSKNVYDDIEYLLIRVKGEMLKDKHIEYDEDKIDLLDSLLHEAGERKMKFKENEPFNDVPTLERNIILDIIELSGESKKNSIFMNKVKELSKLISLRASDMEKLGKDNAESARMTKISYYFGVCSFFISIIITCWDKIWTFLKLVWTFLSTHVFY